jgi:5'-3' exonuclease
MGIPSYFSFIVKNHASIIKKLNNTTNKYNNFFLDCNSIVYDAIHAIDFENLTEDAIDTILSHVCNKIDEYIKIINPNNLVFIAFDGVAPVAKLDQQRARRYKSTYQNNISRVILKNDKPDGWNTAAITPGTNFMDLLNKKIKTRFNNPITYKVNKIILSLSDEFGEGEHKLFQYIRDNEQENKGLNSVVYGLDADLIMLSLNHLPICSNIYLFRETPAFIKSINVELEPNETYILDIPELADAITSDMNNGATLNLEQKNNRLYDYIFLCFFLGNDFMPHFPAVNIRTGGISKMMTAYSATIGCYPNEYLTNGQTIYWKNVKKLVKALADKEEEFLKQESKLRARREASKMPNNTVEDKWKLFENKPTYSRETEKYINVFNLGWQTRYYKTLFDLTIDDVRRQQISINYLQGLEWTMKYYTTGCPDWRWCYQYNYPPLLEDLLHYIPFFESDFIVNKPPNPVNELVQLCYVLPKQSLSMLPKKLYDKLLAEHSDWYSDDCAFIWAYCKYFWESHVDLPHIDINDLEAFVHANK